MKIEITKEELINDFDKVAKVARQTQEPIFVMIDDSPEFLIKVVGFEEDVKYYFKFDKNADTTITSNQIHEKLVKHNELCERVSLLLPYLDFNDSEVCRRMSEDEEYASKSVDELFEDYCDEIDYHEPVYSNDEESLD